MESKSRTQLLLRIMLIVTWVAFIGFMIRAGTILVIYALSIVNPEAAIDFYEGPNMYHLYQYGFWTFSIAVALMTSIPIMNALIAHEVIKILTQFNLSSPFTMEVAQRLQKVAALALGIWILNIIINIHSGVTIGVADAAYRQDADPGDYTLIMAALLFIISQVFKRGVEIQTENDLTV